MNIRQANEISIIDFLEKEGIMPSRMSGDSFWYLSPLRSERTPSFKVSRRLNEWFDFGIAEGGDLVELARRMHGIPTVAETLRLLDTGVRYASADVPKTVRPAKDDIAGKMREIKLLPLQNYALISYFNSRRIDIDTGRMYCREIHYEIHDKRYFAVAFGNISGGYEVRNPYFKGCIGHKDISLIAHTFNSKQDGCLVFEGFMDFLSYLTIVKREEERFSVNGKCDFMIMNSVSNLKRCLQYLDQYSHIHCFLDNDLAGQKTVETISSLYQYRVTDESFRYADNKDVNDYLIKQK